MKKMIFLFVVSFFFISCEKKKKSGKVNFIYVEKASGVFPYSSESSIYEDLYLIETDGDYTNENVKKSIDSLFYEKRKCCEIDSTIKYYSFGIIEKTECTEKYLSEGVNDGCWKIYTEGEQERDYKEALYKFYKRSSSNKNHWILEWSLDSTFEKDTIFCE